MPSKYEKMPFITYPSLVDWMREGKPIFLGHKVYTVGWYKNWPIHVVLRRDFNPSHQIYKAVPKEK